MTQSATFALRQYFPIDLFLPASGWEGAFDRVEVWRSRTSEAGPYAALHGDAWAPAALPLGAPKVASGVGPSAGIVGKKVSFLINETVPVEITFTGTDPLTFAQAASQISTRSQGLLFSYVSGNVLVVTTVQAGLIAALRCTGGDAAPLLGLPTAEPGSLAFGQDARIVLVHGQEQYGLVDPDGSSAFFYKTRFYNTLTKLSSEFSAPFQGRSPRALTPASLVRCYVDLVDQNGAPAANVEVLVGSRFDGAIQLEGRTVTGGSQRLLTDADGRAELLLARGLDVVVAIGGTALARTVTVPTDTAVTALNLLAPANGEPDDLFRVQVPGFSYAVRRTL